MHRLVLLVLAAAYSAYAEPTVKTDYAAGYYSPPAQSPPSYGYDQPSYQPPLYQPAYQPPYYQPQLTLPPFALPTYDVAYCSVHASFPLVGVKKHHKDRHHHHHGPPRTRKFERQSCRYTAVFSWDSCNTCCKIASRTNGNENSVGVQVTEPSRRITVVRLPYAFWSYMCSVFQYDIVGALMVFDPDMDFRRPDDHPDGTVDGDRAPDLRLSMS
ncbi:unnamed protein product [Heligmosomoides polygyrus]|uniref:Phospholipid scramblase n=1 Tax=Heligmosomoides polygyrus TaxID=6339 RepID=A0A183FPP4_HELPZ|nr:unnamed protein product [Heligmosomoides polygyrus]